MLLACAALSAKLPPHTVAIDELPFDSKISDTSLIVSLGSRLIVGSNALFAKFPCPNSRLPGAKTGFASPTLNPGKL